MRKRGYLRKLRLSKLAKLGQLPNAEKDNLFQGSMISLKRRIFSISILSVTGILLYLVFTLSQSNYNTDTLKTIKHVSFPVQLNLVNSLHNLQIIQRELESSIYLGDVNLAVSSGLLAKDFEKTMQRVKALDSSLTSQIDKVLTEFRHFYSRSFQIALKKSNFAIPPRQEGEQEAARSQRFEIVSTALQSIQSTQSSKLSVSIEKSIRDNDFSIAMGYSAGASGVVLIVFLAWFTAHGIVKRINEMVFSLRDIARGCSDLSVRLPLKGKDEMTELAFWFNRFISRVESLTRESTQEVQRMAYMDNLSNLPNRRMLIDCLKNEDTRCGLNPGRKVVGMFLDLDNFKPINDRLGHDAGDELIKEVANRLVGIFGKSTAEYEKHLEEMKQGLYPVVSRLGGDEFFILVADYADDNYVETLARQVLSAITAPYSISGEKCHIGVSIGISLSKGENSKISNLIDQADMAMYEAKNRGKNTYCFFSETLVDTVKKNARIEIALQECIPKKELQLLYQPQFDLRSGEYRGAEALLRWHSSEFGLLTPGDFFKQAEKNGLMINLDQWAVKEALKQLDSWKIHGKNPGNIAINVSSQFAESSHSAAMLADLFESNKSGEHEIELEITASSILDSASLVNRNLEKLRKKNVHIAMDNFGVGESSMQLLLGGYIDVLKLDRVLVSSLKKEERTHIVVSSLISMAESMGLKTIAEGVETKLQMEILETLGCDYAQGHYFAKPMTGIQLQRYMDSSEGTSTLRAI